MIELFDIPAIDEHAHNLLTETAAKRYPFSAAFTEGYDPKIVNDHARHTLYYHRSLRDIARLLGCEPTEAAILECRDRLGLEKLSQICFKACNLEAVFLDDGFQANEVYPVEWHQQFIPVYRLLRLEYLAESLLQTTEDFQEFLEQFRSQLESPLAGVIGFKSIAAYRTGLNIQAVNLESAEFSFHTIKNSAKNARIKLANKPLIDFLIHHALEIASKQQIPVQFHTGFGDPDLDLKYSNPVYLRSILENPAYRHAPIVLLHASYPYMREAGYLASVYPQVYLDFGLAIPMLSIRGMERVLQQLLELAPTSKLMYSSDAHMIPELYYLGAKWGRLGLANVLEKAVEDGDLSALEADQIAIAILRDNAASLYSIKI